MRRQAQQSKSRSGTSRLSSHTRTTSLRSPRSSQSASLSAISGLTQTGSFNTYPDSASFAGRAMTTTRPSSPAASPNVASRRSYSPPTLDTIGRSDLSGVRLVLLGAPGSGKGSFSKYISHYFDIPMISTGDLIRAEIKAETPIGIKAQELSRRGELVGDEIVLPLLKKRIEQPDTTKGYILDGFPRTLDQAKTLTAMGDNAGKGLFKPPNSVLNINLREDVLIQKACARRICGDCGTGYNLADIRDEQICMPAILPQKDGACDNCDGQLIQRADDTEETVRNRLRIYHTHAQPLLDYYSDLGILLRWDVIRGLEDTQDVLKLIEDSLAPSHQEHVRASL